jgi:hypothetical protein
MQPALTLIASVIPCALRHEMTLLRHGIVTDFATATIPCLQHIATRSAARRMTPSSGKDEGILARTDVNGRILYPERLSPLRAFD